HVLVVDDFMAHVDRRAVHGKRTLDDFDGAVDAGAEAAGIGKQDFHGSGFYPQTITFRATEGTERKPCPRCSLGLRVEVSSVFTVAQDFPPTASAGGTAFLVREALFFPRVGFVMVAA